MAKDTHKTCFVTGGAGFIGSHACEALLREGYRVVSLDNFNDFYDVSIKRNNIKDVENTAVQYQDNGCGFVSLHCDIRNSEEMERAFGEYKPECVIHLAAYAGVRPSIANPALYFDVNVNGTIVLLECMKKHGVKRMVFASSSSVYGNNKKLPFSESDPVDDPISPYAASKKAGELICHTYHALNQFSIACLRFFTVYGPRQRPDLAITKFLDLMNEGKEIPFFGDGSTERDYTYIDDIVSGVLKAVDWTGGGGAPYGIFNLGESNTISLSKMVQTLEKAVGRKANIHYMPMQPGDVKRTFADISKARAELGYAPSTDFEKGILEFVAWRNKTK